MEQSELSAQMLNGPQYRKWGALDRKWPSLLWKTGLQGTGEADILIIPQTDRTTALQKNRETDRTALQKNRATDTIKALQKTERQTEQRHYRRTERRTEQLVQWI